MTSHDRPSSSSTCRTISFTPTVALPHRARENPEAKIDEPFLIGTIPQVKAASGCVPHGGPPSNLHRAAW